MESTVSPHTGSQIFSFFWPKLILSYHSYSDPYPYNEFSLLYLLKFLAKIT